MLDSIVGCYGSGRPLFHVSAFVFDFGQSTFYFLYLAQSVFLSSFSQVCSSSCLPRIRINHDSGTILEAVYLMDRCLFRVHCHRVGPTEIT